MRGGQYGRASHVQEYTWEDAVPEAGYPHTYRPHGGVWSGWHADPIAEVNISTKEERH